MGPGGPARQRGSAGSTTNRRPDLERGPSRASVHTEAWARRTARAPARRHATAARCRLAAMKNSFQRSVQWSPAMHREQPVGGLRGGSVRRASGVGKHLFRRRGELEGHGEHLHDGAKGLQPLGPSAGRAPASTPTRSRDTMVDGAAQVRGSSQPRAAPAALLDAIRVARERERSPELASPHVRFSGAVCPLVSPQLYFSPVHMPPLCC